MKPALLGLLLCPCYLCAQNLNMLSLTNNGGIYTTLCNPALAAGTADWLSINAVGAGASLENNIVRTQLHYSLLEITLQRPNLQQQPNFSAPYFATSALQPKKPGVFINTQVLLPSIKLNITRRISVFAYMRERAIGNIVNPGKDIMPLLVDNRLPSTPGLPSFEMDVRVMGYHETGGGLAAVVYNKRQSVLKIGFTLKRTVARFAYLINTRNFTYKPRTKDSIDVSANYRVFSTDLQQLTQSPATYATGGNAPGKGFSADIGFVYEYTPYHLKHRYRNNNPKGKNKNFRQRDIIKYVYRFSFSVMDVGTLVYAGKNVSDREYSVNKSVSTKIPQGANYVHEMTGGAQILSEKKSVKMYLPATALAAFDYRVNAKWFVNVQYSQNLMDKNRSDVFYIPSSVSAFVRKEFRNATHGIPIRIVPATRTLTMGWLTYAGPFFIGTDNIFTFLGHKMYNISMYTGFCITIKYKKDPTMENFKAF